MMKYIPNELRELANRDTPSEWGDKRDALLWAADTIEAGNKLIEQQTAELAALRRHIADISSAMDTKAINNPGGIKASTLECLAKELYEIINENNPDTH